MRRWLAGGVAGLAMGWVLAALGLDGYGVWSDPSGDWDLLIVAGCSVMPDGSPSPALERRAAQAVELYDQGLAHRVLFTGGVGDFGGSEAAAAAQYARSIGLPEQAIVLEEASTSTEENAAFSAALYPAERVLVVSDTYHVFRVERVFGRYYAHAAGVASKPPFLWRIRGSLREVAAVSWYGVKGRL